MGIPVDHANIFEAHALDMILSRQSSIKRLRKSLLILKKKKAVPKYRVNIISKFKGYSGFDDEKDVYHTGEGSLKDVIKEAEKEFMYENRRRDISAHYEVILLVGEVGCDIPSKYWSKYRKR